MEFLLRSQLEWITCPIPGSTNNKLLSYASMKILVRSSNWGVGGGEGLYKKSDEQSPPFFSFGAHRIRV